MSEHKKKKLLKKFKDNFSTNTSGSRKTISPLVHVAFLLVMIVGGIFYLVEVNATSTQEFQIRALQNQVQQLEEIQKELEFRQADVSSLGALQEKSDEMHLVAVERIEAIDGAGPLALSR
ncbi:MAG: hypothetical protein COT25_01755 [Candidatus Kerfeldbacteria bacterium CG08_land_8_20_14_0_20_42_7]|uniref:Cell division protein FtsL n=1 Tax=Candidatus Kerfeldbacteria bacterium CG08_land_8_20_14_0_20_42_7 TaxID=2014245 RepID=A0A2H0YVB5_9BACT|nr:MAG: hypothetical protein COT25_01755 [Candidatus Kerfeldbacteria bacterium CG08_land_8_20_14_0_20_42_7]